MTSVEFQKELKEVFEAFFVMQGRDHHTVNELMYVLEHEDPFAGHEFNISIAKLDNGWMCIPGLDAFVDTKTRGIWFNDDEVEFEVDEFEFDGKMMKVNCITVYEREEE